jgi:poly-gamma-glutamate capsule biosynthesis protein CapA/YwtB (metallophosphatase superfamily)
MVWIASCNRLTERSQIDLSQYPFLYQRVGQSNDTGENLVELITVGDIMPERQFIAGNTNTVLNRVEEDPFSKSGIWLRQADVTLGNLEGVFTQDDTKVIPSASGYDEYRLLIPSKYVKEIHNAGFDLLGLANNHALDLGSIGLENTMNLLNENGIQSFGIGSPYAEISPISMEINGIQLGFLAVNVVPLPEIGNQSVDKQPFNWDEDKVLTTIQKLRTRSDVVIVFIHWGFEYETRPDPMQVIIARKLNQAGADLVLGHHPHVVQGTQLFLESPNGIQNLPTFVAYSLGNFVFDQTDERAQQGLALRILIDKAGVYAVQGLPIQTGMNPLLLSVDDAADLLMRIKPELPNSAFSCTTISCQEIDSQAENTMGIPSLDAIDLTGDGKPETVTLINNRVSILQDGELAWQSPPEWQVLDMALGDPNNDGRYEVVLALMKSDSENNLRSHPFIIGYRGGIYRQVWGGSAVSESIREIELADIDRDQIQELIVLDELPGNGKNTVGVWKWNGWGFSLNWRSTPGHYQDLQTTMNGFFLTVIP